jgi:Leucine-rich repeat (LRR) protein
MFCRILHGNKLIGIIPKELGMLKFLRVLDLGMNQLTGPIPPEIGDLTNLETL